MEINRNNYEAYLLDLLEGRLSGEDQQKLKDFLLHNPDCSGDLMELEPWTLREEKIGYPGIEHLKKTLPSSQTVLTEHNFDLFSIARMEGDLTDEQVLSHQSVVATDEKRSKQWDRWQQARLVAEPLVFKEKNKLKHRGENRSRMIWMSLISAAATIALLFFILRMKPVIPDQEISVQSSLSTDARHDEDIAPQPEARNDVDVTPRPEAPEEPEILSENHPLKEKPDQKEQLPERAAPIADPETEQVTESVDDLRPHPIRISEARINELLPLNEGVRDQIKPLQIQPVSIHISSLSIGQLSEIDPQEVIEEYADEKNLSFWTLASAGINGINKIAGSDISLMASRDEDGEVSGFRLKSRRFSISRPLGQE